jgi:choline-sulfatase
MPEQHKRGFLRFIILILALILVTAGAILAFRSIRSSQKDEILSDLLTLKKPNVLLITVDTIRADHLPSYGYKVIRTPNLDSLAKRGILFRQCATAAPLTLPSHCSIMTGLYPTFHGVRINGNNALSLDHLTLAEAYSANGYKTGAFIGAFVLDGRWGLNQGFDHYDDYFDLKKFKKLDLGLVQRPGNEVVDAALGWMNDQKEKPFFAWVHLYDAHTPYSPPEPFRSEYGSSGLVGLYDGEIAFVDEQIGRCLSWLDKKNLREKTIVAVIGDHGEGLGDHGELTHGYFIYDYAVHVPFILSTPVKGASGLQISSQVRTIDLYPTLLQASGISIPKEIQGNSLWRVISGQDVEKPVFAYSESMTPSIQYGWSPLLSLRTPNYKFIDAPHPELYDLAKDPEEESNIRESHWQVTQEYDKTLKQVVAETTEGAPAPNAANLDSETLERLASLGYIGAPMAVKPAGGSNTLVDPKDRLSVYEAIQKAGELNNSDQYAESAKVLEEVLREDPANPQGRLLLASDYAELKRPQEAITILHALIEEDPKNVQTLVCLANILQDEGKSDEVIRLCKNVIEVDDRNTQALALMGHAYMDMHDFKSALPWLQRAVEIQPKLTQNQLNLAACQIGLKQYANAEATLNVILAEHPKFPMTHFHLGLLKEEQGNFPEAIREYQEEIAQYSNSFMARLNLGRLQLRYGDRDAYMAQMKEVVRLAPKNAAGYLFLARGLLLENASPDEILSLTQQGLSLARNPEYKAMGYFIMADVYKQKNEPQQLKQALAKANEYQSQIAN